MPKEMERIAIEERVRLLYEQSGGPEKAADRIAKLTQQHLLTGKDHGIHGQVETYHDVIERLFENDRSLDFLYNWFKQAQFQANMLFKMNDQRMSSFIQAQEKRNVVLEGKLQALIEYLNNNKDSD